MLCFYHLTLLLCASVSLGYAFRLSFLCVLGDLAVQILLPVGGYSRAPRRTMAKMATRQFRRLLSPHLRHNGGCPRVCCHIFAHKSRHSAPCSLLPAAPFGDNPATFARGILLEALLPNNVCGRGKFLATM